MRRSMCVPLWRGDCSEAVPERGRAPAAKLPPRGAAGAGGGGKVGAAARASSTRALVASPSTSKDGCHS